MTRIIPAGKLPNETLRAVLSGIKTDDPSLIVGPGIGEDTAVLDLGAVSWIAVTTDPITFAVDRIGFYAVTVNANDIAVTGAVPRWFFPTFLFPPKTTEADVRAVFAGISSAASSIGVTVAGGHTEISTAVTRPVICGTMIGTVTRNALKRKCSIEPGDAVVMTKTAGNEGTAILAREFGKQLLAAGVSAAELSAAENFLDRLAVLPEARIGASMQSVRAMHDVTEGGVATALSELSASSGCGIDVTLDNVPVDRVTAVVCRACGLDPLGLIGSGSLLTVIRADAVDEYTAALAGEGIPAAVIGRITGRGDGVAATSGGKAVDFPEFQTDEIARMYGGVPPL